MTKQQIFKSMHTNRTGFLMPNAWDIGSARMLQSCGFDAIATTSSGIAFSYGMTDYPRMDAPVVGREIMLQRAKEIAESVDIPVSGDLENGYGDTPEVVAETVQLAIEAGLAGCNIEDRIPFSPKLYSETLAVERIRAAAETVQKLSPDFVLTARSDAIIWDQRGLGAAIQRSNAYLNAGASCCFTPGTVKLEDIRTLASEIQGPLNMVMGLGTTEGAADEWFQAGVRRISVGGSIARTALATVRAAAEELRLRGTVKFSANEISQTELNALFSISPGRTQ